MVQIDAAQLARSLHRLEPVSAGDITAALQQVITAGTPAPAPAAGE
jgi:hypothetical protein